MFIVMNVKNVCSDGNLLAIETACSPECTYNIVDLDTLCTKTIDYNELLCLVAKNVVYNVSDISKKDVPILFASSYSIGVAQNISFYNNTIKYKYHTTYIDIKFNNRHNIISYCTEDNRLNILHNNKYLCTLNIADLHFRKLLIRLVYLYKEGSNIVAVVSFMPDTKIPVNFYILKLYFQLNGLLNFVCNFSSEHFIDFNEDFTQDNILGAKLALLGKKDF